MITVVYISSSSYSGSTLLSFLLNCHPSIFTVGEMDGWNYGENETFQCSCGEILSACPFFKLIADDFRKNGLPFDPRDFGTMYRVVKDERLNGYLTAGPPRFVCSSSVEKLRDLCVKHIPRFARLLAQQDRANFTFIRTGLSYSGASVFLDACKEPYRLRHLRRIQELDLRIVHLIRDLRGVVLSNLEMKKAGWDARTSTLMWIRQQSDILRISSEFPSKRRMYYEDLCDAPDIILAGIHKFIGLEPYPCPADFKTVENHILGNSMRLSNVSKIVNKPRWKTELSKKDLKIINATGLAFVKRNKTHPVSEMILRYLGN